MCGSTVKKMLKNLSPFKDPSRPALLLDPNQVFIFAETEKFRKGPIKYC